MVAISRMWHNAIVLLVLAVLAGSLGSGQAVAGRKKRAKQPAPAAATPDLLRYLPNDCPTVGTINFAAVRENQVFKRMLTQNEGGTTAWDQLEDQVGVDPERLERLTFGTLPENSAHQRDDEQEVPYVMVVEFNQAGLSAAVVKNIQQRSPQPWEKKTEGPFTLHVRRSPEPWAFYFPNEQTMVCGSLELVQGVLARGAPAQVSPQLAAACGRLDASQLFTLAAALPEEFKTSSAAQVIPEEVLAGMEAILVQVDGQSRLRMRCTIQCRDATIAYQLKGMFGACWTFFQSMIDQADGIDMDAPGAEFLDSIEYAVNDGDFLIQAAIPASVLSAGEVDVSDVVSLGFTDFSKLFSCEVPLGGSRVMPHVVPGTSCGPTPGRPFCAQPAADIPFSDLPPPTGPIQPATLVPVQGYTFNPYATDNGVRGQAVPSRRVPPPTHGYAVPPPPTTAPCAPPSCAPITPYATTTDSPSPPVGSESTSMNARLDEARQEVELLLDRCRRFERRLQLAEQDRDMVEQRVELYRKQLERCEQELDESPTRPAAQPAAPASYPTPYPPARPYFNYPSPQPKGRASLNPIHPLGARANQQLIFPSKELEEILEEWQRYWFLDQPEDATPFRVHGGII